VDGIWTNDALVKFPASELSKVPNKKINLQGFLVPFILLPERKEKPKHDTKHNKHQGNYHGKPNRKPSQPTQSRGERRAQPSRTPSPEAMEDEDDEPPQPTTATQPRSSSRKELPKKANETLGVSVTLKPTEQTDQGTASSPGRTPERKTTNQIHQQQARAPNPNLNHRE
jgi:hypothetical protein